MYKALEIQDVISDIRFVKKQENNAGLQIADFVPAHFMINFSGNSQHKTNIYKTKKNIDTLVFKRRGPDTLINFELHILNKIIDFIFLFSAIFIDIFYI